MILHTLYIIRQIKYTSILLRFLSERPPFFVVCLADETKVVEYEQRPARTDCRLRFAPILDIQL